MDGFLLQRSYLLQSAYQIAKELRIVIFAGRNICTLTDLHLDSVENPHLPEI